MQYNLHVQYVPGAKNLAADYLSRVFVDMKEADRMEFYLDNEKDSYDFVLPASAKPETEMQTLASE